MPTRSGRNYLPTGVTRNRRHSLPTNTFTSLLPNQQDQSPNAPDRDPNHTVDFVLDPVDLAPDTPKEDLDLAPIDFNVRIYNLYKYTKELVVYKQSSYEEFLNFEARFESFIMKLSIASQLNITLQKLVNKEILLGPKSETLLSTVLRDYLQVVPAEDTRMIRERSESRFRFADTWTALRSAYPMDLGQTYLMQLRSLKYDPKESILDYNQNYRTAFARCRRLKRTTDGPGAVEDYLNSLPSSHGTLQMIKLSINIEHSPSYEPIRLEKAMQQVASSILRVSTDGKLVQKYRNYYNPLPQAYDPTYGRKEQANVAQEKPTNKRKDKRNRPGKPGNRPNRKKCKTCRQSFNML